MPWGWSLGWSPEGPAQEGLLSPCDGGRAEPSANAPRGFWKMTPSRAGAVSASEILERQPLGLRGGPVRVVAGGCRTSSLLALSEQGRERGKPQDTDTPVSPWSHGPFSHQPRCQRSPPLRAPASIQLLPSPPSPHPWAQAQLGCMRDEAGQVVLRALRHHHLAAPSPGALPVCLRLPVCVSVSVLDIVAAAPAPGR